MKKNILIIFFSLFTFITCNKTTSVPNVTPDVTPDFIGTWSDSLDIITEDPKTTLKVATFFEFNKDMTFKVTTTSLSSFDEITTEAGTWKELSGDTVELTGIECFEKAYRLDLTAPLLAIVCDPTRLTLTFTVENNFLSFDLLSTDNSSPDSSPDFIGIWEFDTIQINPNSLRIINELNESIILLGKYIYKFNQDSTFEVATQLIPRATSTFTNAIVDRGTWKEVDVNKIERTFTQCSQISDLVNLETAPLILTLCEPSKDTLLYGFLQDSLVLIDADSTIATTKE